MNKLIILIAVFCMLLSVSGTAATVTSLSGNTQIDVSAQYTETWDDNTYIADSADGSYTVTTESGVVTATATNGTLSENAQLMVIAIPRDSEAYEWLSSAFSQKDEEITPYGMFLYSDGQSVDLEEAFEVTLSLPAGYTTPQVYFVASDGSAELLPSESTDSNITFRTVNNSYYVLTNGADTPEDPESPDTGDNSMVGLWAVVALTAVSSLCLFISRLAEERKKNNL